MSTKWKSWADKICAAWQNATESIIATGKLLIEAKKELAHGSFESMIKLKLPFDPRTAQRLMAIAKHPVISNATHASLLPPSWMTLYELTKLPDDTLRKKIDSGVITPKIERKDVVAMRGKAKDIALEEEDHQQPATKRSHSGGCNYDPAQTSFGEDEAREVTRRRALLFIANDTIEQIGIFRDQLIGASTSEITDEIIVAMQKAAEAWEALLKETIARRNQAGLSS